MTKTGVRRQGRAQRTRALFAVLAAAFALAGVQQAAFAAPASAWISEDPECPECSYADGSGGDLGGGGDLQGADDKGADDSGGVPVGAPDDGPTQYEEEHREEIEELDKDIANDTEADRAAEQAYDTEVAEEELRRQEEAEEALQRQIDYLRNETSTERIARQTTEALQRHPELQAMKVECDELWGAVVANAQVQGPTPTVQDQIRAALACADAFNQRLQLLLPDSPPTDLPRTAPGHRRRRIPAHRTKAAGRSQHADSTS
jgi:hypothetical protein